MKKPIGIESRNICTSTCRNNDRTLGINDFTRVQSDFIFCPNHINLRKTQITNSDKLVYLYDLDVIISVGYRVNSLRATQFRRWATNILKTFTIQGYVLDKERMKNGSFIDKDYFEKFVFGFLFNTLW